MELALEIGMGDGLSAADLSRQVRRYLNEPDRLFRRVRERDGSLRLSKAAAACHPGRGVYRSSYKNALRLTATENNMAYRTADHQRWQQLDFVVGIEIGTSPTNHPEPDMCDELAGVYPKQFKFTGWHPWCRCIATARLASDKQMDDYLARMLAGEDVEGWRFEGEVTRVPACFRRWVQDNETRIAAARSLPYFIQDNMQYVPNESFAKAGKKEIEEANEFSDVLEKLAKVQQPLEKRIYVAFEPFSPVIIEALRKVRDRSRKAKLFDDILNDSRAEVINKAKNAKTSLYPTNRGKKTSSWTNTRQMAKDLNEHGSSVSFLPEYLETSSADAIVQFKGKWKVADFKFSTSTNHNTIAEDLSHGFEQADTVVLKMMRGDAGTFKRVIEQLQRKKCPIGNICLINKYGKVIELTKADLTKDKYLKKIKGKL